MRCQSCGFENAEQSVYCGQCRAALARPCPVCGEPVPLDALVCPACGVSPAMAGPHLASPSAQPAPVYRPSPPARAAVAPASGRPQSRRGEGTAFNGVVRDLRHRDRDDAGNAMTVLDFRIERHDPSGNRLAPVPVQMRSLSFTGAVNNGDEIHVRKGKWRDGTLRVEDLDNLTTGARVRSKGPVRLFSVIIMILFALFFVAVCGSLALMFVNYVILGNDQLPWER